MKSSIILIIVKNKTNYLKALKNRYIHLKAYEDIYIKGTSKYGYETLAEHVFDSRYQVVYIKAVLECAKKKYFVYEDVLNETSLSDRSVKRYITHLKKIKWIIEERNPLDKRAKIFKIRIPEDIKILLNKTFS